MNRTDLVSRIFTENTGLEIQAVTRKDPCTYTIQAGDMTFEAEVRWDPWLKAGTTTGKPSITYRADRPFLWKGNRQTSARVEIDPALLCE
jgi:hypothetical protein